jgi:hypothetical protein
MSSIARSRSVPPARRTRARVRRADAVRAVAAADAVVRDAQVLQHEAQPERVVELA